MPAHLASQTPPPPPSIRGTPFLFGLNLTDLFRVLCTVPSLLVLAFLGLLCLLPQSIVFFQVVGFVVLSGGGRWQKSRFLEGAGGGNRGHARYITVTDHSLAGTPVIIITGDSLAGAPVI